MLTNNDSYDEFQCFCGHSAISVEQGQIECYDGILLRYFCGSELFYNADDTFVYSITKCKKVSTFVFLRDKFRAEHVWRYPNK